MATNELVNQQQPAPAANPFGQRALSAAINAGAVSIEQERAIAETQGQLVLAKRFPRDLTAAHTQLMNACKSRAFAAVAFYSKPQGGGTITGPSIRLAEEVARVYGNFQYGHRELSRDDKKSEVEIYVWDMENNNYNKRQITVMHVVDTRNGPRPMRDQSEIDMKINNVASKQVRGLILASVAKWLVEDAIAECRKTLAGNNDEPIDARVRKMGAAFSKYGVTSERLEQHLGHKLDQTTLDELVDLQGMFNSLRDGTPASELFPLETAGESDEPQTATASKVAEAVKKAGEQRQASAAATTAEPTPAPAPAAPAPAPAADPPVAEAQPRKPEQKTAKAGKETAADVTQHPAAPAAEPAGLDDGDVF